MTKKKAASASGLRIEYHDIDDLKRWPRNPKLHDEEQLVASMARHGFVSPFVKDDASGQLVAGHGRLDALIGLREAGEDPPDRIRRKGAKWLAPVVVGVSFASEEEGAAYVIADNRLTEAGGWDEVGLLAELDRLSKGGSPLDALDGTGFGTDDRDRIATVVQADPLRAAGKERAKGEAAKRRCTCPGCGEEFKLSDAAETRKGPPPAEEE